MLHLIKGRNCALVCMEMDSLKKPPPNLIVCVFLPRQGKYILAKWWGENPMVRIHEYDLAIYYKKKEADEA